MKQKSAIFAQRLKNECFLCFFKLDPKGRKTFKKNIDFSIWGKNTFLRGIANFLFHFLAHCVIWWSWRCEQPVKKPGQPQKNEYAWGYSSPEIGWSHQIVFFVSVIYFLYKYSTYMSCVYHTIRRQTRGCRCTCTPTFSVLPRNTYRK